MNFMMTKTNEQLALSEFSGHVNEIDSNQTLDTTGEELTSQATSKRLTSSIWNKSTSYWDVTCSYCNKVIFHTPKEGTSDLHNHLISCSGRRQSSIDFTTKRLQAHVVDRKMKVSTFLFDQESASKELANMIMNTTLI